MKIQFDFINYHYGFTHPLRIIQTDQLDQVISCLQQVEQEVQVGFYAAGFIAYEAAPAFRSYLKTQASMKGLPLLWFAIFDHPISEGTKDQKPISFNSNLMEWYSDTSWDEYQTAIQTLHHHIAAGDSYQINYTLRMLAKFHQNTDTVYQSLLQAQQANYSAYFDCDEFQILSASPELFFHYQDQMITTKPMKGTAPRGVTIQDDHILMMDLHNEKNRAENLMIVDLLRNDLGQIALQGTVHVPQLFEIEKYPTVWQLTSTVTAKVKRDIAITDIFKALFPCGSITGAPKAKTMDIIRHLEKQPRGVYCGAIGIMTPDRGSVFSVPIRTIMVQNDQAIYGVGGGITWDSTSKGEYEEIIHKTKILYDRLIPEHLLESLLLKNGQFFLLNEHLERLRQSALYWDFAYFQQNIQDQLMIVARQYINGMYKIRLLLNKQGQVIVEAASISPLTQPLQAKWASTSMHTHNVFLYHKTTQREFYPQVTLDNELLLFNEKDEVTEFVNGNVVWYDQNEWWTPPLQSGLLNGTMRQYLLTHNKIKERIIYKQDLQDTSKIAFINSVRGWRDVIWKLE